MPTGGLASFRIVLVPLSGITRTAVLEVNSALGHVPGERSIEGIRLGFSGDATEFSEEVSGRVMFLSTPPRAVTPANGQSPQIASEAGDPPRESTPDLSEPVHN